MNIRRHQLDPLFVIPPSHINRWQHVEEDSETDSAVSEMDSDEGKSGTVTAVLQQLSLVNEFGSSCMLLSL